MRKYVIRRIQPGVDLRPKQRRKRKQTYDGQVIAPLAKVWEIFDCPCGQRLKPILEIELDRLRHLGELRVCDEVVLKLKRMSSATIDRKLKHQREVLHLLRSKGGPKPGSLNNSNNQILTAQGTMPLLQDALLYREMLPPPSTGKVALYMYRAFSDTRNDTA